MLSFTLNKVARLWTFGRGGHNLKGDPDGCKALWWKSSMRPEREEFLFMLLLSAPGSWISVLRNALRGPF